jgi:hypothetical protein
MPLHVRSKGNSSHADTFESFAGETFAMETAACLGSERCFVFQRLLLLALLPLRLKEPAMF